jgi:hypothetical protein
LANPLERVVNYDVVITGDGLSGESGLIVPSGETARYDLYFLPLKVGKWRGSVAFISEHLGEVWYELALAADE